MVTIYHQNNIFGHKILLTFFFFFFRQYYSCVLVYYTELRSKSFYKMQYFITSNLIYLLLISYTINEILPLPILSAFLKLIFGKKKKKLSQMVVVGPSRWSKSYFLTITNSMFYVNP